MYTDICYSHKTTCKTYFQSPVSLDTDMPNLKCY